MRAIVSLPFRGATTQNVALYYPYVSPPEEWTKRSLLLFEAVSSIIPWDYQDPSPDLQWLKSEGLWLPTIATSLSDPSYSSDIAAAVHTFANDPRYRFNKSFPPPHEVERLYLGKLNHEIEHALQEAQLSKPVHHNTVAVHRDVATVVLAVTAKYLAAQSLDLDIRLVPTTDVPLNADYAFSVVPQAPIVDRCFELAMQDLLPTPGPDVSLQDIVDFRVRHAKELSDLRNAVRSLMNEVAVSARPMESIRSFRERIDDANTALLSVAKRRRLTLVSSTVGVLLAGAAAERFVNASTAQWAFGGFGSSTIVALASRKARRTASEPAVGPFSYVFYAKARFSQSGPPKPSAATYGDNFI